MLGGSCGELTCELSVREQGADSGSFTNLGLLEDVPSFGIDQLERGGLGRSARVSSLPVSSIILLPAYEVFGCSVWEERGHGQGRETEEEQTQNAGLSEAARAPATSEYAASGMRLRTAGCSRALGSESNRPRPASPRCSVHGGPVTLAERGVQESAHHGDPDSTPTVRKKTTEEVATPRRRQGTAFCTLTR